MNFFFLRSYAVDFPSYLPKFPRKLLPAYSHRRSKLGPGQLSRYSDSLRAGRSGDRFPVGARFSAPVQTAPGAHPASYTMGTGSFPGGKRPGRGADHPPHLASILKKVYSCIFIHPFFLSWPVIGRTLFYFALFITKMEATYPPPHPKKEALYLPDYTVSQAESNRFHGHKSF